MENSKLLSALSYFSVLFAPFILPIIIFFVSLEPTVKQHAKRAFFSHLIPFVLAIFTIILYMGFMVSTTTNSLTGNWMFGSSFLVMTINAVVSFAVLVWNIIQGIKVLR